MTPPRAIILRAPGTNCDNETAFAFEKAGGQAESVHINQLVETPHLLAKYQILCVPGGFSYGDDIAAGRIFANQLRHHVTEKLTEFHAGGKLILGICNGFQVLLKAGLLAPEDALGPVATLAWNDSGKFEDRWVQLRVVGDQCVFLSGIDAIELPVAHAEGKFVTRDSATLEAIASSQQLVLRYATQSDPQASNVPYPQNPNGSQENLAGLCDATGRILGLMPHPERFLDPTQHPSWTRRQMPTEGDGLRLFQNAVRYFL
jgi:phosphoribosylformylglycinamidine synthase